MTRIQSAIERELCGVRCDRCRQLPGVRLFDCYRVCDACAVILSDRLTWEQLGISRLRERKRNGSPTAK
jgi:hypothetical protein